METKIVVPALGESIVEATVARWFKKVGEPVALGEPLVELETDKVNLEVGAEQAGVLTSIERGEQEDVKVGEVLGLITPAGADQPAAPAKPAEPAPDAKPAQDAKPTQESKQAAAQQAAGPREGEAAAEPMAPEPAPASEPAAAKADEPEPPAAQAGEAQPGERVSPLAAKVAQERGIDLSQVSGTGPGGRVLRQDVENFVQPPQVKPAPPAPTQKEEPAKPAQPQPAAAPAPQPAGDRREERVRLSRRRRTIAQRLVEAQHSAAMLTTFNDVDMTAVMDIRTARKQAFKDKYGASLGIVSFFVKASILALQDFPQINAEIQDDEMVLKHFYDIGIAIGDEEGLVVPVLRDADRLSFGQIEQAISGFVEKSRQSAFSVEDLRGGTFTITNGGVYGSMLSTPILNPPQVAILGLHRIEQRPVARDGQVVLRPMMYLALSYDHRIVDGREAVQFLVRIKNAIENPELMMLGL